MRVKHKRGIKREKIPGDSKRVVPRIMSDPSRNMRDHVPGLFLFKVVTIQTLEIRKLICHACMKVAIFRISRELG